MDQTNRTDKYRPKIKDSINDPMPWPSDYFTLQVRTNSALNRPIEEPGRVIKPNRKGDSE